MAMPKEWIERILVAVCRPAATLSVSFAHLDGYEWVVKPSQLDRCSQDIANSATETLSAILANGDSLAVITILDRLYRSSPVHLRVRSGMELPTPPTVSTEVSCLFYRFVGSHTDARLLAIAETSLTMDFTLRDSFDPTLCRQESNSEGPFGCPVCNASPSEVQASYPGTIGCLCCGAIFVP